MTHHRSKTAAATETLAADLLIVGGGLVGLPLALATFNAGLKVVVVDTLDPAAATHADFDGRVSAVNRTSQGLLTALDLWDGLAPQAQPIRDIRVADGDAPVHLHFNHSHGDVEAFGWMIENRLLRRAIVGAAQAIDDPAFAYVAPGRVETVTRNGNGVTATLADGRTVKAPLCVAADGKFSALRQAAGIAHHGWAYAQTGIVLAIQHAAPHHGLALERFLPAGPFAVLPMVDAPDGSHRSGIVWCEETASAEALLALDDAAFAAELTARVGDWLGAVTPVGPRWSYPLSLVHARDYYAERLALVGDAAHAMHPVAGQGLNLGLRDAAQLAETVVEARRLGLDIGAPDLLKRYDRARRVDTLALMGMTDGLTRLFSTDAAPIRMARRLGLAAVNRATPLKRFFVKNAMAGSGSAPRLALLRGEGL